MCQCDLVACVCEVCGVSEVCVCVFALCVLCSSCSNVPRNKLYDSPGHISTIYLYLCIYVYISVSGGYICKY